VLERVKTNIIIFYTVIYILLALLLVQQSKLTFTIKYEKQATVKKSIKIYVLEMER